MTGHVTHFPVAAGGEPALEPALVLREIDAGDADAREAQLAGRGVEQLPERGEVDGGILGHGLQQRTV